MNKIIFSLLGLILFFSTIGQETKKINYQINFGASVSIPYKSQIEIEWNSDDGPITYFKPDIGYFAELMLSYNFNKRMLLNTGASFITSNLQEHSFIGIVERNGIRQTNYLGIPLTFDYQVLKNKALRAGLGLYLNFLINAKEKGTRYLDTTGFYIYYPDPALESLEPVEEYNANVTERFNLIDFGLIAKVEYEFKLTEKFALLVFSKFNFGLAKIRELPNWYDEWRNYNFLFGVGLKI